MIIQKKMLLQTQFDPNVYFSYLIHATLLLKQKRAGKYVSNSKTTWARSICEFRNMGLTACINEALACK